MVNPSDPKRTSRAATAPHEGADDGREALAGEDVALVGGQTPDGNGLAILRSRRGRLEAGVVRPLSPGKPIQGEVVRLKPREACPVLCDVETVMKSPVPREQAKPEPAPVRSGPPQVASNAYRDNWEVIYRPGKKQHLLN